MLALIIQFDYIALIALFVAFILVGLLLVFTYNKVRKSIDGLQEDHKIYRC